MLNITLPIASLIIIDASPTLKAFLDARAKGAPAAELKKLQVADEMAREAEKRVGLDGNVIYNIRWVGMVGSSI